MFRKILIPTAYPKNAEKAAEIGTALADKGAKITALMVESNGSVSSAYLDKIKKNVEKSGLEFESKVMEADSVADAIVTEAAFGGCDLVLLGTREIEAGRHRIGPVTDDVLKRVSCTAIATKYPAKPPKKILVPVILVLDVILDKVYTERAVQIAALLAKHYGSKVTIANVTGSVFVPRPSKVLEILHGHFEEFSEAIERGGEVPEEHINEMLNICSQLNVDCDSSVKSLSSLANALDECTKECDLLVLGTSGQEEGGSFQFKEEIGGIIGLTTCGVMIVSGPKVR